MPRHLSTHDYFKRFGLYPPWIQEPPSDHLGLIVVVPCHNETGLLDALEALRMCEAPGCAVEVLIVVNSAANAPREIAARNLATLEEGRAWADWHADSGFRLHFLQALDLPPKHAGVGLARKIGMDEAVRRFELVGRSASVIANFDADCRCDPNYLKAIEALFADRPDATGCGIYFEHPLDHEDDRINESIALYELHLRYYVQACRFAGFPHAFQTVGSSFAVRADVYRQQGGMNKRKAGEDFYFLHKVIPRGNYAELNETRVIPSPRVSDRVPFGTGKAMGDILAKEPPSFCTYPFQAFLDLWSFLRIVPELYDGGTEIQSLPESVKTYLELTGFNSRLKEIRDNTRHQTAFRKRFFQWFNGFQVMKFLHHARDQYYGSRDVLEESMRLRTLIDPGRPVEIPTRPEDPLRWYRAFERSGGLDLV